MRDCECCGAPTHGGRPTCETCSTGECDPQSSWHCDGRGGHDCDGTGCDGYGEEGTF